MIFTTNAQSIVARRAAQEEREICLRIRFDVFVTEQGFSAGLEPDAHDESALHYIAHRGDDAVGAARAIIDRAKPFSHIGRVAVIPEARGAGVGVALMQAILQDEELRDVPAFRLSAQMHAIPFYERLGFEPLGEPFDAAGAPHLAMHWTRKLHQ